VFLLVWGFRSYVRLLGISTFICGTCQNPAAQRVVEQIRKFTLFWIPLFVVKKETLVTCTFCGTTVLVPKEHVNELLASVPAPGPAPSAQIAPQSAAQNPAPPVSGGWPAP
jgi:hypothetical protein